MGSSWSDFSPVRDVWLEAFGSKPYVVHTLAIAGTPSNLSLVLQDIHTLACIRRSDLGAKCRRHGAAPVVEDEERRTAKEKPPSCCRDFDRLK